MKASRYLNIGNNSNLAGIKPLSGSENAADKLTKVYKTVALTREM